MKSRSRVAAALVTPDGHIAAITIWTAIKKLPQPGSTFSPRRSATAESGCARCSFAQDGRQLESAATSTRAMHEWRNVQFNHRTRNHSLCYFDTMCEDNKGKMVASMLAMRWTLAVQERKEAFLKPPGGSFTVLRELVMLCHDA